MSYTVVHDQDYEQHLMVNEINKAVRHCRIGKVTTKTLAVHERLRFVLPGPHGAAVYNPPYDPIASWQVMDHPRNLSGLSRTYG